MILDFLQWSGFAVGLLFLIVFLGAFLADLIREPYRDAIPPTPTVRQWADGVDADDYRGAA